jgi:hypothetical protein
MPAELDPGSMNATHPPFELFSVVHLVRPAGRSVRNLEELRAGLAEATPTTLFLHTQEHQLRHPAADEPHAPDISSWVNGVLQDRETAERLAFVIQQSGGIPTELRAMLLEVLESIPERARLGRSAPEEGEFVFLEMESVTVPTGRMVHDAEELMVHLAETNPSVLFYHLIEQPVLDPEAPSLAAWVRARGEPKLAELMEEPGRFGRPLEQLRQRLLRRWRRARLGRRIAEAAAVPENARREQGRQAVANLVRRMTQGENP